MSDNDTEGFVPTDYVAMFSALFEYTSDAVCIMRVEDGTLLDVNRSFLELFELRRAEAIGRCPVNMGIWLSPEDQAWFDRELQKEGRVEGYGASMRSRRGTEFWVSISAILAEWRRQPVILAIAVNVADGEPHRAA